MKNPIYLILSLILLTSCGSGTNNKPTPDNNESLFSTIDTIFLDPVHDRSKIEELVNQKIKDYEFGALYELIDEMGSADILLGHINGQIDTIIGSKDSMCLSIVAQLDFDEDGWDDVLMENITACGGNCCGNSYFFATYAPTRGFSITKEYGYSWEEPNIDIVKEKYVAVITSLNEGNNTDNVKETIEQIMLKNGKAVLLKKETNKEMKALKEMRASEFNTELMDEIKTLEFDLDGDKLLDKVEGTLWHRWGRVEWKIHFSSGKSFEGKGKPCKRIGVLSSKTNGVHDLVLDLNSVIKWDGEQYVLE